MAVDYKTLDDIINTQTRYDINNIMLFTMTDDQSLIISDTDLFQIYYKYIEPYITTYKVTKEQREKYARKPEWLSQDIYGSPDLAWLLIRLNDMECASKFYLKNSIRAIDPEDLNDLYDTVITRSNAKINKNWNEYIPESYPTEEDLADIHE